MAGFTWILLYKEQAYGGRVEEKARELVRLVRWMTREGHKYAEPMRYTPLPKAIEAKAETLIESVTYDGKSLSR